MKQRRPHGWGTVVACMLLAMAGCGGGGASAPMTAAPPAQPTMAPVAKITDITVFGDGLQDIGVMGYRYTVQEAGNLTYVERVAAAYGKVLCSGFHYASDNPYFMYALTPGCTNYSLAGAQVESRRSLFGWETDISLQMSIARQSAYADGDLVIVNGGATDANRFASAYLAIQPGDAASLSAFAQLFIYQLTPAQVEAAVAAGATALTELGSTTFRGFAAHLAGNIQQTLLGHGASHVVVVNMPDVTVTPRFQRALDEVASRQGGGAAGAAARARTQTLLRDWISAYNAQLARQLAGDDRVIVVDLYQALQQYTALPSLFGLTNVTVPICPSTAAQGRTPTYDIEACTPAVLSAAPPAGVTGSDWWKTYAFADDFYPSPYLHQLIAQRITLALTAKRWL